MNPATYTELSYEAHCIIETAISDAIDNARIENNPYLHDLLQDALSTLAHSNDNPSWKTKETT